MLFSFLFKTIRNITRKEKKITKNGNGFPSGGWERVSLEALRKFVKKKII